MNRQRGDTVCLRQGQTRPRLDDCVGRARHGDNGSLDEQARQTEWLGPVADGVEEVDQPDYRELAGECAKFLAEIEHEFEIDKFTHAELDEEEAELEKLQRWHERTAARDVHGASGAEAAGRALRQAEEALERYAAAAFEHTQP